MALPERRGLLLAFGAALVSGFSVFVNAYGVKAVPDATVYTTAKNLVAAVILALLALAFASAAPSRPMPRLRRGQVAALSAVAVIGGSIPFVLFFEGLARASSNQAQFVHKTLVIWVALLAVPLLGEKLRWLQAAAIGTLVLGQALIGGGLGAFRFGGGEWLILVATLLWAIEVVVAKRLLLQVPARVVALVRMGGGVVLLVAWVAVSGRWSHLAGLSGKGWMWAALTGTILAGYVALWFAALALAPAVDVTAVLVVAAVVTGVLNVVVKGTPVTAWTGSGMLVVLFGTALAALAARTRSLPAAVSV
jgi:drug/metabolite transporter (DMT)-like permease